jgi:nitrite reductase (NADH) small subunit
MTQVLIPVAKVRDIPSGSCLGVEVKGEKIAVYNVEGEYYALDAICPHEGGPLERGRVEGYTVTCPWHLWQYDVRTGVLVGDSSVRVRSYKVHAMGEDILLDFTEVHERLERWEKILAALDLGREARELSVEFGLPVSEIEEAARRYRIGKRLIWLGELYREQGVVGAIDLLRMPKREAKSVPYGVIPLIDELTRLL